MSAIDEEFPKVADLLPASKLSLSEIWSIRIATSMRYVWVRRYTSRDKVPGSERDILETGVGLVPTQKIDEFMFETNGQVALLKYNNESWKLVNLTQKEDIDAQIFAYQIKPYTALHRIAGYADFEL